MVIMCMYDAIVIKIISCRGGVTYMVITCMYDAIVIKIISCRGGVTYMVITCMYDAIVIKIILESPQQVSNVLEHGRRTESTLAMSF